VQSPLPRPTRQVLLAGIAVVVATVAGTSDTGSAIANGETRTLEIYHTHTKESGAITYKRNGQFDREALEKLNWMLRDWRRDEPITMDPRLFDIVWEVRKEVGSHEPLNIVSAYRAPETNAMLRHRSRAVAKHSQHMLGKAMDFYLPDVSMSDVREIGLRLQRGGVGYYPTAYNPFVHLDAGSVRHWPRMSHDQLARLFPDGKTVHIPSDGKPMARYDEAAAEIEANGGSVSAYASAGDDDGPGVFSNRKGKSFFAALFGGGDEEEGGFGRGGWAAATRPSPRRSTAVAAYAPNDDRGGLVRDTSLAANQSVVANTRRFDQQVFRPSPAPEEAAEPVAVAAIPQPAPAYQPAPVPAQVAVAAPAPPVLAPLPGAADVPMPVQRPVALASLQPMAPAPVAGPQMVWQQGPSGQGDGEGRIANVPLPLARPSELAQVFANVPLPQARPVQVASTGPMVPAFAPPAAPALGAIVAQPAAAPHASPLALPPAPLRTAVAPAPAPERIDGQLTPGTFDRSGLNALFASANMAQGQVRAAPVSTSRTRAHEANLAGVTAKPASAIAYGFGQSADLPSDHFAGPAVKALPVTSFAKR
jgi:uncharacterized protein YcbK (DUF882 family)